MAHPDGHYTGSVQRLHQYPDPDYIAYVNKYPWVRADQENFSFPLQQDQSQHSCGSRGGSPVGEEIVTSSSVFRSSFRDDGPPDTDYQFSDAAVQYVGIWTSSRLKHLDIIVGTMILSQMQSLIHQPPFPPVSMQTILQSTTRTSRAVIVAMTSEEGQKVAGDEGVRTVALEEAAKASKEGYVNPLSLRLSSKHFTQQLQWLLLRKTTKKPRV